jgi:hypothetical protein
LPETGGLNHATTRNRTLAVGKRIEKEIRGEIDHPSVVPEPAVSEWLWESMAHSLKQGILGRAKGISLRFSPGRVETSQRAPWCETGSVCKEAGASRSPTLRSRRRHGFEKRWTIATLVSARAGGAAGKTQEPKPKQQGARVSCDRRWPSQMVSSPRCSSMR